MGMGVPLNKFFFDFSRSYDHNSYHVISRRRTITKYKNYEDKGGSIKGGQVRGLIGPRGNHERLAKPEGAGTRLNPGRPPHLLRLGHEQLLWEKIKNG